MSKRTKAKAENRSAAVGQRSGALWWGGLVCGVLLMLEPGSVILVAVLLLPVVLLLLLPSRHGGARTAQASMLFGLAACVHPLHVLWQGDTGPAAAIGLLRQPMVMPTAWIALLAGWLVSETAAAVLRVHSDIVAAGIRRRMMENIATIEEEWGPMPASAPLPPL